MCELLWSDPQPGSGRAPSKRGVGVAFGADVTQRFLQDNGLELLVRSHEVQSQHRSNSVASKQWLIGSGACLAAILKGSFCKAVSRRNWLDVSCNPTWSVS